MAKHPFGRIPNQPPRIPLVALDKFGNRIEKGHLILHDSTDPFLVYEVVDVRSIVLPNEPNGQAVTILLQTSMNVQVRSGAPTRNMIICGETQARVEARAGKNGQGLVLTDAPVDTPASDPVEDDGGPGVEGAPRDLGDTGDKCDGEHVGEPCADLECWQKER